ncbi:MAG TPA: orotate phosphoribosyltransferase [Saprospiraceae bacterium]|nr:orotate phosphoribosyltransferase [Saprospiraceae bacterium]
MTISQARDFARTLIQIKAIQLNPQNPFTWASGLRSPIYCDNRMVLSYPDARNKAKQALISLAENFTNIDAIAGVATAGIPHGALLADALNLPFIYVRSKPKEHGRQNLIEGHFEKGQKVLVIEDLISTGGSSLEAIRALKENGLEVLACLALFTYEFPESVQRFKEENCPLFYISSYTILLEEALATGYIDATQKDILAYWKNDPKNWYQHLQNTTVS